MSRRKRRQSQLAHERRMREQSKPRALSPRERELQAREARVAAIEAEQEKVYALTLRHEYCGTSGTMFAKRGNPMVTEKDRKKDAEAELASTCQVSGPREQLTGSPIRDSLFRLMEEKRVRRQTTQKQIADGVDLKQVHRDESLAWEARKRLWKEKAGR